MDSKSFDQPPPKKKRPAKKTPALVTRGGKAKKEPAAPPPPQVTDWEPCLDGVEFDGDDRALVFDFIRDGKRETIRVTDFDAALDQMIAVAKEAKKALGMK